MHRPLTPGHRLWIRCEVRPGPFPDERLVKIGNWVGFVPVTALEEPVQKGHTYVLGYVLDVGAETYTVAMPGDSPIGRVLTGTLAELAAGGPVEA